MTVRATFRLNQIRKVQTMTAYFSNPKTLEDLRKQYKDLLKKYHPDNPNGSEEATKDINNEYETLFKMLNDVHNQTSDDTTSQTYDNMKWDFAEDEELRNMLSKAIQLVGLNITIVGNWIWIDGDTYPHKAMALNGRMRKRNGTGTAKPLGRKAIRS